MRLLLHAITSPETSPIARPGLRGQRLVRVEGAALLAWASEFQDTSGPFDRSDLFEHHEIISTLHAAADACLPARFPTWLADGTLQQRRVALLRGLERVRGRCEVAVTAVWTVADQPLAPTPAPTSGAGYLRARQRQFAGSDQRRERARGLASEIERLVADNLLEAHNTICPSAGVALSAALLVPRASVVDVIARLPRVQRDVRILVNGPWPPYTFADVREE
jgi:hypothetical protein